MKNIFKAIVLVVFSSLLFSCEKEIAFSEEQISPKLIVNGFVQQDSLIKLTVSASKAIPGVLKDYEWIDDATVTLFVDGIEKESLSTYKIEIDSANYYNFYGVNSKADVGYTTTSTIAEAGKTYRIEVSHPKYKTVYAETTVPTPIKIERLDTVTEVTVNNNYTSRNFKVKLLFTDPMGQENYYRIIYKLKIGLLTYTYSDTSNRASIAIFNKELGTYIDSDDKVLNPNEEDPNDFLFGSPSNRFNIFSDERINGKSYQLSFNVDMMNSMNDILGKPEGEFGRLDIRLQSISKEEYLYMKSLAAYSYYEGDPFAEPVQVFTNVENGAGIFAAFSTSSAFISKGEYPIDGIEYIERDSYYY